MRYQSIEPPPQIMRLLIKLLCMPSIRAELIADFDEEFAAIARRNGPAAARRWYARQALLSLGSLGAFRLAAAMRAKSLHGALCGVAAALGASILVGLAAAAAVSDVQISVESGVAVAIVTILCSLSSATAGAWAATAVAGTRKHWVFAAIGSFVLAPEFVLPAVGPEFWRPFLILLALGSVAIGVTLGGRMPVGRHRDGAS